MMYFFGGFGSSVLLVGVFYVFKVIRSTLISVADE